jgi:hypothetical protein
VGLLLSIVTATLRRHWVRVREAERGTDAGACQRGKTL